MAIADLIGTELAELSRVSVLRVEHPDGFSTRLGDREPNDNVASDLTWSNAVPGGHRDLSCSLLRNIRHQGREGLLHRVVLHGAGSETLFDGRLHAMPRSSDGGGRLTPQAAGWQAALTDDETATAMFRDRELARWGQITADRRAYAADSYKVSDGSTGWHSSVGPTIDIAASSYAWGSNAGRPYIASMYDAGPGARVRRFRARMARLSSRSLQGSPWVFQWLAANAPDFLTDTAYGLDLNTIADGSVVHIQPDGPPRRFLELGALYPTAPAGSVDDGEYGFHLHSPCIDTDHGMPEHPGAGVLPDGQDMTGLLVSDMLSHTLGTYLPKNIRWTTGTGGTIEPTSTPIAHVWLSDPTTVADIVTRLDAFEGRDWAVWDDGWFHYPENRVGRTWVAWTNSTSRADTPLSLSPEGDTIDGRYYTGIVVSFTDFAGRPGTVGPLDSNAEIKTDQLRATDVTNPAVATGTRRLRHLQLSAPVSHIGAIALGMVALAQSNQLTRKGTAVKRAVIRDETGKQHPYYAIRAGHYLRIADVGGPPRKIVECVYNDAERSVTMSLDNPRDRLTLFLERYAASLSSIGIG
ncbi:hypothetical protein SK069_05730 [Patulibacter brassicae]|uniref:Uncharacterized protein n=1 Tax=Patulibacter brassicae TaxID=1705717 RepID=A0ABU4VIW5_9ACTN|nr:hypothetical protein [Patulibacter brassicae]MDX8151084.1 hypothetical protein [Patulibacter brassicae]